MASSSAFEYDEAFSRNIGWFTETEQRVLKNKTVAIAGLGGVGGSHLVALARLGITRFHISDFDIFEQGNFNRQAGARMSSVGQPKLETLKKMALDINPDAKVTVFEGGINESNVDEFLDEVDVYLDGLDFFAVKARQLVFDRCYSRGIPAVTAAPLGMGTAVLCFMPDKMSFEDYFQLNGQADFEQYLRFFVGLSPVRLSQPYLVDPSRANLHAKKGPSTIIGCELATAVAVGQVAKILLGRGEILAAPWSLHFDAYRNKFKRCYRPGGNSHPLQKLSLLIARRFLKNSRQSQPDIERTNLDTPIKKVLDLAKWAPSGDNTQPWRFELIDSRNSVVHGSDTRDWVVYDLQGRASQLAVGALLESVKIAAASLGYEATIKAFSPQIETTPKFQISLATSKNIDEANIALADFLKVRCVQRKPMKTKVIADDAWEKLQASLPTGFKLVKFTSWKERWQLATLMFANAKVRLTIPEAFKVHREIIDWGKQFSEDKIPDQALGSNSAMLKFMPWLMKRWERVEFFNRFLLGTLPPRIELDLVPGLLCAGHIAVIAPTEPKSLDDYLEAGAAMQRFWLTAAKLGIGLQPEMTPLIFSDYVRKNVKFTNHEMAVRLAEKNASRLQELLGDNTNRAIFMARVGYGKIPRSRSTRPELYDLLWKTDPS